MHLCLGVPSYPLPHEERFACYVLNTLLGGGMSSRLFQNIRERQGLGVRRVFRAESVPGHRLPVDLCRNVDRIGAEGGGVDHARSSASSRRTPVSDEELRRAKDHLKGSLMLSLESTSSRMSNLARQEMYFGQLLHPGRAGGEHRGGDRRRRAADRADILRSEADCADGSGKSGEFQASAGKNWPVNHRTPTMVLVPATFGRHITELCLSIRYSLFYTIRAVKISKLLNT